MDTFFATLLIVGAIMAAMSIGVAVSGRQLRGSCGGTDKDCECDDQARRACALRGQRG
jgi:hypothetical protein